MATIGKVATAWAGTSGGPGITQVYIEDIGSANVTAAQAQTAVNAMRTFWDAIKAYLPDEVSLTVQATVDMYDAEEGQLTATVTAATPPTTVTGTSATAYAMAAGMKANLQTANIRNGRRVRGSIFIVPATTAAMATNGTIASAARTAVNAAGATMITSLAGANLNLIVWGRPVYDDQGALLRNGTVNFVQTIDTNEKACILRGRRD